MANCETLPLCPDTELAPGESVLTEPLETGPFIEGLVFVRLLEGEPTPPLEVAIGLSPVGYEDWEENWAHSGDLATVDERGMHAIELHNFGNWLRVRFELPGDNADSCTIQAWFVGKG